MMGSFYQGSCRDESNYDLKSGYAAIDAHNTRKRLTKPVIIDLFLLILPGGWVLES
jgi:hypothetical protein